MNVIKTYDANTLRLGQRIYITSTHIKLLRLLSLRILFFLFLLGNLGRTQFS